MNTKTASTVVISATVGIIVGSLVTKYLIKRKLVEMKPAISRMIVDCCQMIEEGELTTTELYDYMNARLEFLKKLS